MADRKKYYLDGCMLNVSFDPQLIHIRNSAALRKFIASDPEVNTGKFITVIKTDYLNNYDQELDISDESFAVELWGHIYFGKFAEILEAISQVKILDRLSEKILNRTRVIDCGEAAVDNNRIIWDILAVSYHLILALLLSEKKK